MDRRDFLSGASALLLAAPALGQTSSGLRSTVEALERRSGGRLGLVVLDTRSGARFAWRGDERFPLCSTFKFLLAAAILSGVDRGRERLDRRIAVGKADLLPNSDFAKTRVGRDASVAELARAAIVLSDNAAANLLLPAIGEPEGLTRFARSIGDGMTRLDRSEPSLGQAEPGDPRDTTTPAAMAANLRQILLGSVLKPASRARLKGWMVQCRTGKGRLRAGLPAGWRVGNKTGTGMNGTANDIAIIWPGKGRGPLLIAAYLTGATVDAPLRESILASVGHAVATGLGSLRRS